MQHPTPIGQPAKPATPSVKLRTVGDWCDVALIDVESVPWIEFGSELPKIGKDGQPRTQDRITALVTQAGSAVVSDNGDDTPVAIGDVVSIYASGAKRWDFIQAQKLNGQLLRGDVMRVKYDHDEPPATKGYNDKKVWTFQIRHAKPDEAVQSARCEEIARGGATPINHADDMEPF